MSDLPEIKGPPSSWYDPPATHPETCECDRCHDLHLENADYWDNECSRCKEELEQIKIEERKALREWDQAHIGREFCYCGHALDLHHHADECHGPACACQTFREKPKGE